jgi:hypothetical protein
VLVSALGSATQAISILASCRKAMTATSRLLILEMLIGAENTPVFANMLDLMMLVLTSGRERTLAEYRQLASRAGLDVTRVVPTRVPLTILEAEPIRSEPAPTAAARRGRPPTSADRPGRGWRALEP